MSKIITAITQWFRSLLWAIAEIFLFLLDCLWKVVLKIGSLNIGGSTITSKFFILMSACMLIFIVFKLVKIYVKFFVDNEYRENINLSKILISLSLASMLISGVPLIYKSACSMTSDAIEHVNYWIPNDFADEKKSAEDMSMSDVLIQSGRVNLSNRIKYKRSKMEKETRKMKLNYAKTIEKWGIFEMTISGPKEGNPFCDQWIKPVRFTGIFQNRIQRTCQPAENLGII